MSEKCRICGETTQNSFAKQLFDTSQNILLHQIELLTGEWLNFDQELPCYICMCCEQDLNVAAAFRERCIQTQRSLREDEYFIIAAEGEPLDPQPSTEIAVDTVENKYVINDVFAVKQDARNLDDTSLPFNIIEQTEKFDYLVCENVGDLAPAAPSSVPESPKKDAKPQTLKKLRSKLHTINKKRKYISWKNLSEDQAAELKRLQRKRDCICEQCGKHFTDPSNFKLHLLRHTGVKNFQCKTCDEKFYTPHLLRRHEMLHTGLPLYSCHYCDATFKYCNLKTEHERRYHTLERPFPCSYCDKRFTSSTQRKDHELVHTGVRNYLCEWCDQRFLRSTHLVQHLRSKTHKNNEENLKRQS